MSLCCLVPAESAPRGDKLSASVTKGKKNKEGKESRSNKGQPGSRPSSQVGTKRTLLIIGYYERASTVVLEILWILLF